eukprot:1146481-Pelagomonas_calceolata.AAC.1
MFPCSSCRPAIHGSKPPHPLFCHSQPSTARSHHNPVHIGSKPPKAGAKQGGLPAPAGMRFSMFGRDISNKKGGSGGDVPLCCPLQPASKVTVLTGLSHLNLVRNLCHLLIDSSAIILHPLY